MRHAPASVQNQQILQVLQKHASFHEISALTFFPRSVRLLFPSSLPPDLNTLTPDIYVVSYSGENTDPRPTHRNSLAGTTRTKFSSRSTAAGASSEPPSAVVPNVNPPCSSSSPVSASSLSPSTPPENSLAGTKEILGEDDEMGETEDDEVVLIPNAVMSEDILKGFEELRRANSGSTRFDQTRDI